MIPGLGLIIVAAGSSSRMQGTDKIWALLDHRSVLWHSLHALSGVAEHTVVVVREGQQDAAQAELATIGRPTTIVSGGPRRQDSVARGLDEVHAMSIVAVHDAARPLAVAALLLRGVELLDACDGAVPALPVSDTIKPIDEHGSVLRTVDRSTLRSVQTPQVFRLQALQHAHASQHASARSVTDDASLLEACRFKVRTFPGQEGNVKITTAFDLWLARQLLKHGHTSGCE